MMELDDSPRDPTWKRILCVDDEPEILRVLRYTFEDAGFEVATAPSGPEALRWIDQHGLPHLAVIDICMPVMDGLELCERIRDYCDLPIVLLTAVDDEPTVVAALNSVADDYVLKPFNPVELAARVQRVLRRVGDFSFLTGAETAVDARLAVNFVRQEAKVDGRAVPLTSTEAKILQILMRSSPRPVAPDYLLRRVWPLKEVYSETLRVHIHRLRHKLEADPDQPIYIHTHRGHGYSFLPAPGSPRGA